METDQCFAEFNKRIARGSSYPKAWPETTTRHFLLGFIK